MTYVPARNTVFLSLALGWAEVLGARHIFIGVNAVDYSGYPDCRPEFISAFETLAKLATKAGVEGEQFIVNTPLIELTKAQIIRRGLSLGVDYSQTVSCYQASAEGLACGVCDSCRLRARGFAEAGVTDPIRYSLKFRADCRDSWVNQAIDYRSQSIAMFAMQPRRNIIRYGLSQSTAWRGDYSCVGCSVHSFITRVIRRIRCMMLQLSGDLQPS